MTTLPLRRYRPPPARYAGCASTITATAGNLQPQFEVGANLVNRVNWERGKIDTSWQ
jgi:hypothetical protein